MLMRYINLSFTFLLSLLHILKKKYSVNNVYLKLLCLEQLRYYCQTSAIW